MVGIILLAECGRLQDDYLYLGTPLRHVLSVVIE